MLAFLCLIGTLVAVGFVGVKAFAATETCRAIAHRAGPTPTIDDNTLEGIARSGRLGCRAELDVVPVQGGRMVYHEKRWDGHTNGTGQVHETTFAYAKTLTTSRNGQQVPTLMEALNQARISGTPLLLELHHWPTWTQADVDAVVSVTDGMDVWFTGTLAAHRSLPDDAERVYRLDGDEPTTRPAQAGATRVMVGPNDGRIAELRDMGLRVLGRQSGPDEWLSFWEQGVFVVQTNLPALYEKQLAEWGENR